MKPAKILKSNREINRVTTATKMTSIRPILLLSPVILALITWTLGLAGSSFFFGFEEKEPATWLSLFLMGINLLICVAAAGSPFVQKKPRILAGVLSVVIALAMLDEYLKVHELIGKWTQRTLTVLPKGFTFFTDDILILIYTVGVIAFLWWFLIHEKPRFYSKFYILPVAICGILHGLLDLFGHQQRILRMLFGSNLLDRPINYWGDLVGFYEECFKLWTEWFLILFLVHALFRLDSKLKWSVLVCSGSILATMGLFQAPGNLAPVLTMGSGLDFIRNPHYLATLAVLWLSWGWIISRNHSADTHLNIHPGLFFILPVPLLLHPMWAQAGGIKWTVGFLSGPTLLMVGAALVTGTAYVILFFPKQDRWILLFIPGLLGISWTGFVLQPWNWFLAGGLIFPLLIFRYILPKPSKKQLYLILVGVTAVILIQNLFWLVIIMGVLLYYLMSLRTGMIKISPRIENWIVAVHIAIYIIIGVFTVRDWLPQDKYEPHQIAPGRLEYQMVK